MSAPVKCPVCATLCDLAPTRPGASGLRPVEDPAALRAQRDEIQADYDTVCRVAEGIQDISCCYDSEDVAKIIEAEIASLKSQRDELLGATKEYMKAARPDARRALKAVIERIEGAPMPDRRRKDCPAIEEAAQYVRDYDHLPVDAQVQEDIAQGVAAISCPCAAEYAEETSSEETGVRLMSARLGEPKRIVPAAPKCVGQHAHCLGCDALRVKRGEPIAPKGACT